MTSVLIYVMFCQVLTLSQCLDDRPSILPFCSLDGENSILFKDYCVKRGNLTLSYAKITTMLADNDIVAWFNRIAPIRISTCQNLIDIIQVCGYLNIKTIIHRIDYFTLPNEWYQAFLNMKFTLIGFTYTITTPNTYTYLTSTMSFDDLVIIDIPNRIVTKSINIDDFINSPNIFDTIDIIDDIEKQTYVPYVVPQLVTSTNHQPNMYYVLPIGRSFIDVAVVRGRDCTTITSNNTELIITQFNIFYVLQILEYEIDKARSIMPNIVLTTYDSRLFDKTNIFMYTLEDPTNILDNSILISVPILIEIDSVTKVIRLIEYTDHLLQNVSKLCVYLYQTQPYARDFMTTKSLYSMNYASLRAHPLCKVSIIPSTDTSMFMTNSDVSTIYANDTNIVISHTYPTSHLSILDEPRYYYGVKHGKVCVFVAHVQNMKITNNDTLKHYHPMQYYNHRNIYLGAISVNSCSPVILKYSLLKHLFQILETL